MYKILLVTTEICKLPYHIKCEGGIYKSEGFYMSLKLSCYQYKIDYYKTFYEGLTVTQRKYLYKTHKSRNQNIALQKKKEILIQKSDQYI